MVHNAILEMPVSHTGRWGANAALGGSLRCSLRVARLPHPVRPRTAVSDKGQDPEHGDCSRARQPLFLPVILFFTILAFLMEP